MLDINTFAAGDGFIPKVLKGAAEQELRNDAGDEPCDGYGCDGDAADGEFADREDAVVEPEDGEFEGRHGYRKYNGVGEEQLGDSVSHTDAILLGGRRES